jgi:hypothetical protein
VQVEPSAQTTLIPSASLLLFLDAQAGAFSEKVESDFPSENATMQKFRADSSAKASTPCA